MIPSLRAAIFLNIALLAPLAAIAVDETVLENLTISQDLLVHQTVKVGCAIGTIDSPAYAVQANSIPGLTILDQTAYGTTTTWNWLANDGVGAKQLLRLENLGKLSLYDPESPTAPVIILDAQGPTPRITIAGKNVVTEANIGTILASSGGNNNGVGAVGLLANAGGDYSSGLGTWASATGNSSSVFGVGANAEGGSTSALGAWAKAIGDSSTAVGKGAYAEGSSSSAWGDNATAMGESSNALGKWANAEGDYSNALGTWTVAKGNSSSAFGVGADAKGGSTSALGAWAKATGDFSTAVGVEANAEGVYSTALGYKSASLAANSFAAGYMAYAEGDSALAAGFGAWGKSNHSVALGYYTQTTKPYQIALGSLNQPIDDAYFMVGNGTLAQRSNLFVIMKDGRGVFRSTGYVEPTAQNPKPVQPVALTVEGSTEIKGTLRVRPAGDLPMGMFTAGDQP